MKFRLFSVLFLAFLSIQSVAQESKKTAIPVQKQLDAYNNRDIDKFLVPYSDSVKIYNHPKELIMSGKAQMRARFSGMFANTPDLHCTLINRMVLGNTVIDQEYVIFNKNNPPSEVLAMYVIENDKIQEVYFIRPKTK